MRLFSLFPNAEGDHHIYAHAQNLNEDRHGHVKGSMLRHGRAWLHVGRNALQAEWVFLSSRFHLGVELSTDSEGVVRMTIAVPPVALYLALESWTLSRRFDAIIKRFHLKTEDDWGDVTRDTSIRIFSWAVWWHLWTNPHHHRRGDLSQGSWHPFGHPGSMLGKPVAIETREVEIPMPERTYRWTATLQRFEYSSPWFPLLRRTGYRADMKALSGEQIPVPGKGENSWDCGEDAHFGLGCPADSIEQAVGKAVESALRTRLRYGGKGWRPAPKNGVAAPAAPAGEPTTAEANHE